MGHRRAGRGIPDTTTCMYMRPHICMRTDTRMSPCMLTNPHHILNCHRCKHHYLHPPHQSKHRRWDLPRLRYYPRYNRFRHYRPHLHCHRSTMHHQNLRIWGWSLRCLDWTNAGRRSCMIRGTLKGSGIAAGDCGYADIVFSLSLSLCSFVGSSKTTIRNKYMHDA